MKSAFSLLCTLFLVSILLSSAAYSATLHVPSEYSTIQKAVDAAVDGDEVLVAPGTYNENVRIENKKVHLTSEEGPESTFIYGDYSSGPVVLLRNSSPSLSGFTICNGSNKGVHCRSTESCQVFNNIIINNAHGIEITGGEAEVYENTIMHNSGGLVGGGIYCWTCDSNTNIHHNIIANNVADLGGGIRCSFCSPWIKDNVLFNNSSNAGGAICLRDSDSPIINNMMYDNQAKSGGAIACILNSSPKIVNNTIFNNNATTAGGGLFCVDYSNAAIMNTILWDNTARKGDEIYISSHHITAVTMDYSVLKRDIDSVFVEPGGSVFVEGSHMIYADPEFVDRTRNDLHLYSTSPCIDAGTQIYTFCPHHDWEGDSRFAGSSTVDIGADEFSTHLYATGNKTPGGDVEVKIVGEPGEQVHALLIGTERLLTYKITIYGPLYLMEPYTVIGPFGAIPSDGVMKLEARIPLDPPAPYDVAMQALKDNTSEYNRLTNLEVLKIR